MKIKNIYISLFAIAVIICFFNPSYSRFKEFTGETKVVYEEGEIDPVYKLEIVRKRVSNYLLWSVYEIGYVDNAGNYKPRD